MEFGGCWAEGCSLCNRQALHIWGGLERGGVLWSLPPVRCWELRVQCLWHGGARITPAAPLLPCPGLWVWFSMSHPVHTQAHGTFSKRCVPPPNAGLNIPGFGSGNCPCLVAESVFNLTLPSLKTSPHLNFPGLGSPELSQISTQAVCLLLKEQGQLYCCGGADQRAMQSVHRLCFVLYIRTIKKHARNSSI